MIVINPGLICIIYVRVSTRRQANHRVQDEIDLCQKLAMKHSLTVMEIFVDAGATGFTDEREAYKKMLACIREHKGRLQYVIVPDVSRAWRNFPEYIALRATAAMHGVQIVSAREGAIDGTIEGQLIEDTLAFAASYQARTKNELIFAQTNRLQLHIELRFLAVTPTTGSAQRDLGHFGAHPHVDD